MLDFFLLHSFLCKEHKNQNDDMTFCVVYTETCVSLQLVTTKSVWKYRTEWNFEKRISDSGPSKHAWILVYSSRIKFYSHPKNPGNVPCKLHEKQCKVHGFLCSLHTSRTCTYSKRTANLAWTGVSIPDTCVLKGTQRAFLIESDPWTATSQNLNKSLIIVNASFITRFRI